MFVWFSRQGIIYKPINALGWTVVVLIGGYILYSAVSLLIAEPLRFALVMLLLRTIGAIASYWVLARVASSDAQKTCRSKNGRIHDRSDFWKY